MSYYIYSAEDYQIKCLSQDRKTWGPTEFRGTFSRSIAWSTVCHFHWRGKLVIPISASEFHGHPAHFSPLPQTFRKPVKCLKDETVFEPSEWVKMYRHAYGADGLTGPCESRIVNHAAYSRWLAIMNYFMDWES